MNINDRFGQIWGESDGPASPKLCPAAKQFADFAQALYQEAEQDALKLPPGGLISVNQKKLMLLDKYFEYRSVVPKAHRNHTGTSGHRCIWQVFEEYYNKLRVIELRLVPPPLYIPPPPPAPKGKPQIEGLVLGEEE